MTNSHLPCNNLQEYVVGESSDDELFAAAEKFAKGGYAASAVAPSSISGWSATTAPAESAADLWRKERSKTEEAKRLATRKEEESHGSRPREEE